MTEAMKTEGTFKLSDLNEFDGSPYEVSRPFLLENSELTTWR